MSSPYRIATVLFLLILSGVISAADRPPNVILILIDDMGWTDLSCYGSQFYETPNITPPAPSAHPRGPP